MIDPTQRFSTRVENYIKYRPAYPKAILDLLRRECKLNPAAGRHCRHRLGDGAFPPGSSSSTATGSTASNRTGRCVRPASSCWQGIPAL